MELFSTKNKKLLWIIIGAIAALLVVLMLIGTFLDYRIAHGIGVDRFSFFYIAFGMTFEVLGFLPAILVDASLLAVLSLYAFRKRFKIAFHIGCAVFWTLANHGIRLHERSSIHHGIAGGVSTVVGAILSFPFIKFFKRFSRSDMRKLIYILAIGAVMATLANAASGIMQMLWGRYRFYAIIEYDVPFFTRWYRPFGRGGTAEGFGSTSFPSLHATSVASIVMLPLSGLTLKANKNKMMTFWIIAGVMLLCVPLSRMVLRWHFLTYVTFSLLIGLLSFTIGILVIDFAFGKRFLKFVNNSEDDGNDNVEAEENKAQELTLEPQEQGAV